MKDRIAFFDKAESAKRRKNSVWPLASETKPTNPRRFVATQCPPSGRKAPDEPESEHRNNPCLTRQHLVGVTRSVINAKECSRGR